MYLPSRLVNDDGSVFHRSCLFSDEKRGFRKVSCKAQST